MNAVAIEGGCFCGAVRYRASAGPQGSMLCHCRWCRGVSGAPLVGWLTFARGVLVFTRGTPVTFESSPPVRRQFCGRCGTQLTYTHADSPDEVDIATCTLDEPNAYPPTHHSWLSHDLQWVRFGDGLPTFARSRYGS